MIYKHKLSFRNVSNDLCVTTHKYQAIWPQIIFTFSFMNPITLTFKCLKLHVTCLLLIHKTLNMREWIAWYPQIVLLTYMGFWGKFKPSSFCIQVSVWNKCVQIISCVSYRINMQPFWDIFLYVHIESIGFHFQIRVGIGRLLKKYI